MSNPLLETAKNNVFFHDFIIFLREIEKEPLELTASRNGNIKVKEIKRLGEAFEHDIYHRDKNGNIRFAVRVEDDFPYITWHKQIAKIMHLTYLRKQKILLSKNGKGFLQNATPDIQFREMIHWYLHRADWRYVNWRWDTIVNQLQLNQALIWQFLLNTGGKWIKPKDLYEFLEEIIPELKNSKPKNEQERIYSNYGLFSNVIKKTIIEMLKTFDLIDTKEKTDKFGDSNIVSFRINETGVIILMKAMTSI